MEMIISIDEFMIKKHKESNMKKMLVLLMLVTANSYGMIVDQWGNDVPAGKSDKEVYTEYVASLNGSRYELYNTYTLGYQDLFWELVNAGGYTGVTDINPPMELVLLKANDTNWLNIQIDDMNISLSYVVSDYLNLNISQIKEFIRINNIPTHTLVEAAIECGSPSNGIKELVLSLIKN